MRWERVEKRMISWQVLWYMEAFRVSFNIKDTYDMLPFPRTSANGMASLWHHSGFQDQPHHLVVSPTTSSVGKAMLPPFHPCYLAGKQQLSSGRVTIKPVFHFKSRCWTEDHGTWLEVQSRLRNALLPICHYCFVLCFLNTSSPQCNCATLSNSTRLTVWYFQGSKICQLLTILLLNFRYL